MNYLFYVLNQVKSWLGFKAQIAVADSMKNAGLAEKVALPDPYFRNDFRLLAEKMAPNYDVQIVDSFGGIFLVGYYADIQSFREALYTEVERRRN